MSASKYNIDFEKMISWILPGFKRKSIRVAWLNSILKKIRDIHTDFITQIPSIDKSSKINGQAINIENHLISVFGLGVIVEIIVNESLFSTVSADDPAGLYVGDGIDTSHFVGDGSGGLEALFKVSIPAVLNHDDDRLIAILEKYKIPGSTYIIEVI